MAQGNVNLNAPPQAPPQTGPSGGASAATGGGGASATPLFQYGGYPPPPGMDYANNINAMVSQAQQMAAPYLSPGGGSGYQYQPPNTSAILSGGGSYDHRSLDTTTQKGRQYVLSIVGNVAEKLKGEDGKITVEDLKKALESDEYTSEEKAAIQALLQDKDQGNGLWRELDPENTGEITQKNLTAALKKYDVQYEEKDGKLVVKPKDAMEAKDDATLETIAGIQDKLNGKDRTTSEKDLREALNSNEYTTEEKAAIKALLDSKGKKGGLWEQLDPDGNGKFKDGDLIRVLDKRGIETNSYLNKKRPFRMPPSPTLS